MKNYLDKRKKSSIINNVAPIGVAMREWRNWQTRTFEGRVVYTVRVQVPFLAPNKKNDQTVVLFVCDDAVTRTRQHHVLLCPSAARAVHKQQGIAVSFLIVLPKPECAPWTVSDHFLLKNTDPKIYLPISARHRIR